MDAFTPICLNIFVLKGISYNIFIFSYNFITIYIPNIGSFIIPSSFPIFIYFYISANSQLLS